MQIFEKEINLYDYLDLLKRRWWMILALTIIFGSLFGYRTYSSYVPVYETSTTILMHYKNSESLTTSSRDFSVGINVISTFTGMLNSNSLRSQISEKIDSNNLGSISVSASEGSIMKLTVQHTDAQMAADIANVTSVMLLDMAKKMMSDISLSVLDEATVPYVTSGSGLNSSIIKGVMVGLVMSVGILILIELLDTTIKSPKEIEERLGMIIMGVIPDTEPELAKYRSEKSRGQENEKKY